MHVLSGIVSFEFSQNFRDLMSFEVHTDMTHYNTDQMVNYEAI
jgi:hypothetical protein